jgi:DHA2 family multidrug resistance protein
MSTFDLSMTAHLIMLAGFVQGLGTGLLFAPLSTLSYATLDPAHRVEGTIVSTMARSLGSSVGISVVQSMVIRDSALAHSVLAGGIDASSPLIRNTLPAFMDPTKTVGLMTLNGEVSRQAGMIGYVDVFSWMTILVVVLIPLLLILRPAAQAAGPRPGEVHGE